MLQLPRATPFLKALMIALFVAYLVQIIGEQWIGTPIATWLALEPEHLSIQTLTSLFTYPFAASTDPQAVISFLLGLLFLWWALGAVEMRYGARRAAELVVVSTLAAGVCALVAGQLFVPGMLAGSGPWVLAAIAAFAVSLPRDATLSFFGILAMRPHHLLLVVLAMSGLQFLTSKNVIGLAADLGAIGSGIAFVRWMKRPRTPSRRKKRSDRLRMIPGGGDEDPKKYLN